MKRFLSIILALLLLTACGDKAAPSSQGSPSSGGGLVVSQSNSGLETAPDLSEPSSTPEDETTPDPVPEEMPDSAPETQRNQTVETMLRDHKGLSDKPALADGKPSGLILVYGNGGERAQVPIPSSGPGIDRAYGASLRSDAVVIAYSPEDGSDTIAILSTGDRGQSWQSSSLELAGAGKYNIFHLAFRDSERGILILRQRISDEESAFAADADIILSSADGGMTWSAPAPFSAPEAIFSITTSEDGYTIAGENDYSPVILRSGDGVSWNSITPPLDPNKYLTGYCVYAAFSGDTGLAVVYGRTPDEDVERFYLATADGGRSWSPYQD